MQKLKTLELKTTTEKAEEWGVTQRYLQQLCQNGNIGGVTKQAGVWFIPDDAPNPVKKIKSDAEAFRFTGTKERIFFNAVKLFREKGFENVTLHEIARASDIQQSAVYNHFESKQSILDTAYGFFCYYANKNRPSIGEIESLLEADSLMDIITKGFLSTYPPGVTDQMLNISKIIVQRMTVDEKANVLFCKYIMEDGVEFVQRGLNRAIELGRLAPHDSYTVSVLVHCVRMYVFMWWLLSPPDEKRQTSLKDEQNMYEHIVSLLTDLKPPVTE
jgi:AcrR family transcriptional regulator